MRGLEIKFNNKMRDTPNITIRGKKEIIFNEGDLIWLHLINERFPIQRKSKLSPKGDSLFKVLRKVNYNAYQLDLPHEYGVHSTFNVANLRPFARDLTSDEDSMDLRTNPS